jgi:nucleotide-binding universal stress UspA family protein
MFKHILIPTDGSVRSEEAVRQGIHFAHSIHAHVTCFHAIPKFHASDAMMGLLETNRGDYAKAALAYATSHLRFVSKTARANGVPCDVEYTSSDDPADAIVRIAKSRDCDLILMASHGRRGVEGFLLGSETQKVLTHSRIPVLVYR